MASGTFIYARRLIASGDIILTANGGASHPKLYAMLYNTSSTIGTTNIDGGSAALGFSEAGIEDMADIGTLGEYLPGDSSSADTTQAFNWGFLMNESSGWVEMFVATTAMGATRSSISFGSLASATLPAKGILIYQQAASSAVPANDKPIAAFEFNTTVNGNGTEFTVTFNNNHSFLLLP